jgi:hypothetical protein
LTKIAAHTRIPVFPYAASLQGAKLDNLCKEMNGNHCDLVLEYHEFSPIAPPELFLHDGKVYERVHGETIPRRLRFLGIKELKIIGVYKSLEETPLDHPAREIRGMLSWIPVGRSFTFYILFNSSPEPDSLSFYARQVVQEELSGELISLKLERNWSPTPPMRSGLVPQPKKLYERFGGDPITIRFNSKLYRRRLFIGSLEDQPVQRPKIDSVLNLGEEPSKWVKDEKIPICDRWINKGEGDDGMKLDEIRFEAEWVIERLKASQRVLVHCVAGMNRSSTICCAVLIMLEGLSAEQALERVREHHPWARPDSNHWLSLHWLAKTNGILDSNIH